MYMSNEGRGVPYVGVVGATALSYALCILVYRYCYICRYL